MPHSHLVVRRISDHADDILLAQKNLYLPPRDAYQYAAIAGNAAQYIIPGGREAAGEQPLEAAVREFCEDTGVQIPLLSVRLLCVIGERSFYEVRNPSGIDLAVINGVLRDGTARSAKCNNLAWVSLDAAPSWLGMKNEYQYLPWVTKQVEAALEAGFKAPYLGRRVNEPHAVFVEALSKLGGRR
jgi:ADP-ribose pyrophosphatase YjhB (NUDIX family)